MKKSNAATASAAALILAGALTGLAACQMEMVEYLPLPPAVPYASIVEVGDGAYKYVLDWKRDPGVLYPDGAYEKVSDERLEDAFEKWELYSRMIYPLPFYDTEGTGIAPDSKEGTGSSMNSPFDVGEYEGGNRKIDNRPGNAGNVILHRYWLKLTDSLGNQVDLNRSAWLNAVETRKADFKKAAAEIEYMMETIRDSPLYIREKILVDGEEKEVKNLLASLYDAMADFISYNPPLADCRQRYVIDWVDNGDTANKTSAWLTPGETCPLYEYYLGHAPDYTEYTDRSGNAQFALPGTR